MIATAVMVKFRVRRMTITTEACFWEAILVHVTLTLPGAQFSDRQPNYTPDYQRILPVWEKSKGMLIISSYSISRSNPGVPHESSPCDFISGIWMFTPLQTVLNQPIGSPFVVFLSSSKQKRLCTDS